MKSTVFINDYVLANAGQQALESFRKLSPETVRRGLSRGLSTAKQKPFGLELAEDLSGVCLVRFMVESPAQFGRLKTLIHPGLFSGVHVRVNGRELGIDDRHQHSLGCLSALVVSDRVDAQ